MGRDTRRYLALVIGQRNSFKKTREYCVTRLIIVIMVLLVVIVWLTETVPNLMEELLYCVFSINFITQAIICMYIHIADIYTYAQQT